MKSFSKTLFLAFLSVILSFSGFAGETEYGLDSTTSAALGKRAWNLNAIGIIDCAVAPQPCRKTNR